MAVDRSAALVLRVWCEPGSLMPVIRVMSADTSTDQPEGGTVNLVVTSSVLEATAAVQTWLEDFLRGTRVGH